MKTLAKASTLLPLACCMLMATQAKAQATPAASQTPASQTSATRAVQSTAHHPHRHAAATHAAAAKPAVSAPVAAADPVLPAGVPAAAGPVQTLFALRYVDVQTGTGELMAPGDYLSVHYTGWLAADGTKFDSSVDRGQPFPFRQGEHRVIAGWDQGFTGMHVGGKRRLFIPYQLAYGDEGRAPIPPKSDLIFDIELVAASATPLAEPAGQR